jgi:hypothetical protein
MMNDARRALKLLAQVAALDLDDYQRRAVEQASTALRLMPMSFVLDLVMPGSTIIMKALSVGVSRNTWYMWSRGETRPNKRQAARLAALTGIPAEKFCGRR